MSEDTIQETFSALMRDALDHHHAGRLKAAEELYQAILGQEPKHAPALHYKGVVALQTENHQLAHYLISSSLAVEPDDLGALVNLATVQAILNNPDGAMESYNRALTLDPRMPEIHYNLGILHQDEGQFGKAGKCYAKAIEFRANYVEAHYNLGVVLQAVNKHDEAATRYEKTLELDPGHAPAITNLGHARQFQGRLDEAVELHNHALDMNPGFAEARCNLGQTLQAQGLLDDAERQYRQALTDDPDFAQCHVNLALLLLLTGNSNEGWVEYEWRWKTGVLADTGLAQSKSRPWTGQPLDGKHLLIVGEQGIGEQIMFSTMIPEILGRGASVTFACDDRLVSIYARSMPEITVLPLGSHGGASLVDYHITAGSLAQHVADPSQRPALNKALLQADPTRVQDLKERYAGLGSGPIIGIAWRSDSPTYQDRKNIGLEQWRAIFEASSGCTFVSLQYGETEADLIQAQNTQGVHIHTDTDIDPLTSLDDHAAQIAAVDHVISISNASVHLAGALGTPCSVIVGDAPPWHWYKEGNTSRWYSSLEIFRRKPGEDWSAVIDAVAATQVD